MNLGSSIVLDLHQVLKDTHCSRRRLAWGEAKIKKLINGKLGIENIEIESAHRIGKEERDEPSQKRTFIATFLNDKDKNKELQK